MAALVPRPGPAGKHRAVGGCQAMHGGWWPVRVVHIFPRGFFSVSVPAGRRPRGFNIYRAAGQGKGEGRVMNHDQVVDRSGSFYDSFTVLLVRQGEEVEQGSMRFTSVGNDLLVSSSLPRKVIYTRTVGWAGLCWAGRDSSDSK